MTPFSSKSTIPTAQTSTRRRTTDHLSQTPSYKITGDIKGIDGTIYLTSLVDRVAVDSTELAEGKFTFEGSVKGPKQYFLTSKNNKRAYIPFFIENSVINISADLNDMAFPEIEISGSASQDVMNSYDEIFMKPYNEKRRAISKTYTDYKETDPEKSREEFTAAYNELNKEITVATLNFIKDNQ